MKRIIATVIILCITACVFAACGKGSSENNNTTDKATVATKQDDAVFEEYYNNTVTLKGGETTSIRTDDTGAVEKGITIEWGCKECSANSVVNIRAHGTANAEFSVALYNDDHTDVIADGIANVNADEDGLISISFTMPASAKIGTKLMVIREVGTENYAYLPINVIG